MAGSLAGEQQSLVLRNPVGQGMPELNGTLVTMDGLAPSPETTNPYEVLWCDQKLTPISICDSRQDALELYDDQGQPTGRIETPAALKRH